MRAIFVSYRRDDSEGEAGRLFDDLVGVFGEHSVFMDVAAIEVGRDFRKAIDESVATCGVLLAIIGRNWLDAKDETGRRRLDDQFDFVRLETASALKRDIPVIPVLVHGARMPRADQLPDDLKELAYRNGVELTHARWSSDVQLLIKALRPHVEDPKKAEVSPPEPAGGGTAVKPAPAPAPTPREGPSPRRKPMGIILGIVAAVLVAGGVVAYMWPTQVSAPDLTGSTLSDATARLQSLGLAVGHTRFQPDPTKAPDIVLSQSPAPNEQVKRGSTVDLVLSQQPQQAANVEVPSVSGKTLEAAEQALKEQHLTVGSISHEPKSDVAQNTVFDQFPKPGKKVEQGAAIDLVVAEAPVQPGPELVHVPEVVGRLLDQARSQLQAQGLSLGKVTKQPKANVAPNTVLSQSPGSDKQAQRGSRVDLTVAEQPPPAIVTLPVLSGLSLQQAQSRLQGLGLALGNTTQQPKAGVAPNTVLSQTPVAGAQVTKGSRVDLTMSVQPKAAPPIQIAASSNPQVVSRGEQAEITVLARGSNGAVIPNATVTIRAGGGTFLGGGIEVTGNTDGSGVYRAIWKSPTQTAVGFVMDVEVTKEGFQEGHGQVTVRTNQPSPHATTQQHVPNFAGTWELRSMKVGGESRTVKPNRLIIEQAGSQVTMQGKIFLVDGEGKFGFRQTVGCRSKNNPGYVNVEQSFTYSLRDNSTMIILVDAVSPQEVAEKCSEWKSVVDEFHRVSQ